MGMFTPPRTRGRPKNPARADPVVYTEHGPGQLPALRNELNRSRARGGFAALQDDKTFYLMNMGHAGEAFHSREEAESHALQKYGRRSRFI